MIETLEIQGLWIYACASGLAMLLAVWWLFFPKSWTRYASDLMGWVLILYGMVEVVWGICQVYGLAASHHSRYVLTGSFYNPGPYSGFLAMIFPMALYEWMKRKHQRKTILYWVASSVALGILCILPAGMSRSAWIAATVSSLYILLYMCNKETMRVRIRRYGIWIGMGIVLTVGMIYLMKKDSADGRLLMWKVASMAVVEQPMTGYGWTNVAGAYGQAQEHYFAAGQYTAQEEYVAGSPEYVFNEYLQIALAWGVPALLGMLLVVGICGYAGHRQQKYGWCGALLAFVVFAFSSYPLQFPVFVGSVGLVLLVCGMSALPREKVGYRIVPAMFLVAVSVACGNGSMRKSRLAQACHAWQKHRTFYQSGAYKQAVEAYTPLYGTMKWNARFLFEYGHALHKLQEAERSNEVLQEALKVSSDPMILNIMGKNEQRLAHYEEAEHYLLCAVHRLPGRIYPYFLLANLYAEPAFYQLEKLKKMVTLVLEKEPKVQSTAIRQMRQQAKELLHAKELVKRTKNDSLFEIKTLHL